MVVYNSPPRWPRRRKKVPPGGPTALCYEAWKLICVEVDALELYGYEALLSLL